MGDAVYSLYVREKLVLSTDYKTGTLQKLTSSSVSAHGQSGLLEKLLPLLVKNVKFSIIGYTFLLYNFVIKKSIIKYYIP